MRIIVFSQVRMFGEAVAAFLDGFEDVTETLTCHRVDCFVEEILAFGPDVVLIDITDESALREARAVSETRPEMPIVGLAVPEMAESVIACADNGLVGYVPRQASLVELKTAVDQAYKEECTCHPKISISLLRELRRRRENRQEPVDCERLTPRETEILRLVSHGSSNKEIAKALNVSVATVKNHVHSIFAKLHTKSRTDTLRLVRNEPWLTRSA